jgi:hypothetical protein
VVVEVVEVEMGRRDFGCLDAVSAEPPYVEPP